MIPRGIAGTALLFTLALLLTGYANAVQESDVSERSYVYENDGFGSNFTITINDDGSFSYYEGVLSSYMGGGEWTLEEDILLLSDNGFPEAPRAYTFEVDREDLVFIADKSDDFLHVKVSDGERFLGSPAETSNDK